MDSCVRPSEERLVSLGAVIHDHCVSDDLILHYLLFPKFPMTRLLLLRQQLLRKIEIRKLFFPTHTKDFAINIRKKRFCACFFCFVRVGLKADPNRLGTGPVAFDGVPVDATPSWEAGGREKPVRKHHYH